MENKFNCNKDTVNNSEIPLCVAHQAGIFSIETCIYIIFSIQFDDQDEK